MVTIRKGMPIRKHSSASAKLRMYAFVTVFILLERCEKIYVFKNCRLSETEVWKLLSYSLKLKHNKDNEGIANNSNEAHKTVQNNKY